MQWRPYQAIEESEQTMDSLESMFSLRGHVALVTGASSGLGVECARALAIAGADVVATARRAERVESLAAELARDYHVRALGIGADVTADADLDRVLALAREKLGEVDILVNNAGAAPTGRAETFTHARWDQTLAVNLTAPMMLAQRVARGLIERQQPGRIINMVSIYAGVASSVYRMAAYCATKAGLANLTRQLAVEWARYNILVNAIAPGWIPTEATEGGLAKPGNQERIELFTPMNRLGRPEEIRSAVIFLASPAASYVTGSVVAVDGGYQAW
jgi:NAD(P)-dependent dehydrogenase (short-subunit alcohol dehydrogenase family)